MPLFEPGHVFVAADLVILLEADLDERRVHRRVSRVDRGKIRRGADVRNDHPQILRRNHLADQALHFGDFIFSDGQARSAGRFDIDHELPGIRARKERKPEQWKKQQAHAEQHTPKRPASWPGRRRTTADRPVVELEEMIRSGC